jgi:hypothetical protein
VKARNSLVDGIGTFKPIQVKKTETLTKSLLLSNKLGG